MKKPNVDVSPDGVLAYAKMFGINIDGIEPSALAGQLAGGLKSLADLRAVDVDGVEPFVVFPIDRVSE